MKNTETLFAGFDVSVLAEAGWQFRSLFAGSTTITVGLIGTGGRTLESTVATIEEGVAVALALSPRPELALEVAL